MCPRVLGRDSTIPCQASSRSILSTINPVYTFSALRARIPHANGARSAVIQRVPHPPAPSPAHYLSAPSECLPCAGEGEKSLPRLKLGSADEVLPLSRR